LAPACTFSARPRARSPAARPPHCALIAARAAPGRAGEEEEEEEEVEVADEGEDEAGADEGEDEGDEGEEESEEDAEPAEGEAPKARAPSGRERIGSAAGAWAHSSRRMAFSGGSCCSGRRGALAEPGARF
jgi:hypothetical protein